MMKKILFGLLGLVVLASCTTPADYFETINSSVFSVETDYLQFKNVAAGSDESRGLYEKSAADAKHVLDMIKGMPPCEDNDALRQSAVEYVSAFVDFYENEYPSCLKKFEGDAHMQDSLFLLAPANFSEKNAAYKDNLKEFAKEFDLYVSGF